MRTRRAPACSASGSLCRPASRRVETVELTYGNREASPDGDHARISDDKEGQGLGVERQTDDSRRLADRIGLTVAATFIDNDISASTPSRRTRPQYTQMLQSARHGEFCAIIAYSNSRPTRRPREAEDLIELAERHGVRIITVVSGEDNLSTADGRQMARIKASIDAGEAERTSERVRRQKDQAAKDGRYRGGPRPYGYEVDGLKVRDDEAKIIREATTAVLAGRTLGAVARELNEQGKPTSTGRPWTYARLRDVLIRPRNAGLLSRGRYDRDTGEITGPATWLPIVDEETWRAVHKLLTDPARRKQQGNAVRWLGSGIYTCSKCSGSMRCTAIGGHNSQRGGNRRYYYRCVAANHLMIRQDKTDDYVAQVVAELVRDPRVAAAMQHHDDEQFSADRERRVALERRLANFLDDYGKELVTGQQLRVVTDKVTAELEEIEARMAVALQQSTASPVLNAIDPGEAFLDAPVDVQRAVLAQVLMIEVLPSSRRGVAWSADRIRLRPVTAS